MGRASTRPRDRLRPSRARLILLAVLAARLAAGPEAAPSRPAASKPIVKNQTRRLPARNDRAVSWRVRRRLGPIGAAERLGHN